MKMIATHIGFYTSIHLTSPAVKSFFYRLVSLRKNAVSLAVTACFFAGLFYSKPVIAQAQTIGSFPEMQGGVENQTVSSLPVGTSSYPMGATVTTFSRNNNTSSVAVDIRATGGHSGPQCLEWACSSTSSMIFTPTAAVDAVLQNTSYVVQFFARENTSTTSRKFSVRVYTNGATYGSEVNTTQTGTPAYQKFTAIVTTSANASTGKTGYVGIHPNGGSFGTGLTYLVDDICMYPGTSVDVTAPDDATSPVITGYTSSSLSLSWTAPATGVDGGGYVVVRYPTNPVSEPDPVANGIYAVGNSIGTGTVVYIGTGTSFTNTGLSASTNYYYKVYVADKAFNYSTTPVILTGYTGLAGPTLVSFNTPGGCSTSSIVLSWTGPLNYNAAGNTLLAFIKQGSAITVGSPNLNPSSYNASTNFSAPVAPNYQNDALGKCVYKGDGTNAAGDHSGLTITGLLPNTTYYALVFNVVDAGPTYSAGSTANGTTLTTPVAEPTNHPTLFSKGTVTTSNITPSWTAAVAGTQAPLGYYLQASAVASPLDAGIVAGVPDGTDVADQVNISGGSANVKVTPNTATSYGSFTGFTAGTMYYFRINSYTNGGSCIDYKSSGATINAATLPDAVTLPSMSIGTGGNASISWTLPASYNSGNHTTLVFVKPGSAITTGTPVANPGGYIDNPTVGSGTAYEAAIDPAATCVYNGDGSSVNINGLGAGTYYVLVLTAMSTPNSDGTYSYSSYSTTSASTGNVYYWQGGASGSWATGTNWNPTRSSVANNDILIFNTGTTVAPASIPSQIIGQLQILNNSTVTLKATQTITIRNNNGLLNADLIVSSGSSLILGGVPNTFKLYLSQNTTADISGSVTLSQGATYSTDSTGAFTTVSGTFKNSGILLCSNANMLVTATGTYEHALNGVAVPTATWNSGSTCLVSGVTSSTFFTGSGHGQSFSNFIWDCPSQTTTFVLGSAITTLPWASLFAENLIVKRTGTGTLVLTSPASSGNIQKDFVVNNYYQYGGTVDIANATNDGTVQRSLTVNNNFSVSDAIVASPHFRIVNTPTSATNARLFVKGNVDMINTAILEKVSGAAANAELWFSGSAVQTAKFATTTGNIDFVASNTGSSNISLLSNAIANNVKLAQGNLLINGNIFTLNGTVSYPSPSTGTLGGSSTSSLVMGYSGNAGTLNFTSGYREMKDFTQLSNNILTLGTELVITAGLTPGRDSLGTGATLNTNDNLVIRSDNDGTARLAPMTGTSVINGKVTVERYLPMATTSDARRWRLLTAPFKTTNAPTINAAWQEGQSNPDRTNPGPYDPKPGYGTHITRSTTWAADGYDQGSSNNSSIYYYSSGSWLVPANTNSVKITDNGGVYMLFARGDRSTLIAGSGVAASPTTLEPKGELNVGNVTLSLAASGYQAVGNPYASQIKLDNVVFNDTLGKSKTFYFWDPKTLGSFNVGKFITCSGNGNGTYTYTANTSGLASNPGLVESSGAFIVKGNGGSIVFHESDKTKTSSVIGIASRPSASTADNSFGTLRTLYTDLYVVKDGQAILADGVANLYAKSYANSIDHFDAEKLTSFTSKEELSIRRETSLFAIERRNNLFSTDTIFLNISKLGIANYQFGFRPMEFSDLYSAVLEDTYLHSSTPVSLGTSTVTGFSITADPASASNDRFRIIFTKNVLPLSVQLAATVKQGQVILNWVALNQEETIPLSVERSVNGKDFTMIADNITEDIQGSASYKWQDNDLLPADYFYRIPYINEAGKLCYSNTVKIAKTVADGRPAVLPNPVTNGQVNLYMGQLPAGIYTIRISNNNGQLVYSNKVNHQSVNGIEKISLRNTTGLYHLEILSGGQAVASLPILLQ